LAAVDTGAAETYTPPPADKVPGYFAQPMPCKIVREDRTLIMCDGKLLEKKSLRELTILRNTIFARYGWDGYRKPWLRDYFHAQPWFKPNPKFSYSLLSDIDRKNAHLVATREQTLSQTELDDMREKLMHKNGKRVSLAQLSSDEKIELGLISRALGEFALDDDARGKTEASLERLLKVDEVRQLSLRDLRLVRNTIYARRGRRFKSEILQDHFAGMKWYAPRDDYSDKLLSANDQRNIALIKSVENELGGPLTDEDWLKEPAIDGA
jgi:hypothetical protein